jgi:two-component system, OmpR family, osmolarity sensor histidine kinase EnvZ
MTADPLVAAAAAAPAKARRERRSWRMFWRVFAAMVATIVVGSWSFGSLFGVYQDRATAAALAPLWAEAVRSDAGASAATRRVEIAIDVRAGEPPPRAVDLSGDARMKAMAGELAARGIVVREIRLDDSLDPPVTWLRVDRGGGASRWAGVVGGLQPSGYGRRLGLGLLALVVIALAVAAAMSRWVASPLARLVGQIDGIARGEAPHARVRGVREIERLGDALRAMADRRFADEQRLRTMLLGVSHDLRSPLARIRVAAELLGDDAARLRDTIVRNVGHADAIIDSFLAYVRAEEESADDSVDLADVARRAAQDAQLVAAPGTPIRVRGNATMLQRLVANLIDNAERHGAPPVTVEVFVDDKTNEAVLRVADRGPGIADPARLRRAFERGDAARGRQGAGLGLAIVDRIAERHGGSVEIASPGGVGTTVTIRLPLASAA